MTVSGENNRNDYTADGLGCTFAYTFPITTDTSLDVYICEVLTTSGFTVSGAGSATGGTVTFSSVPAVNSGIVLIRDEPYTQGLDLIPNGIFSEAAIEQAFDVTAMRDQQLLEAIGRAPKFAPFSRTCDVTMPTPRVGSLLRWASCTALENACSVTTGTLSLPAPIATCGVFYGSGATAMTQDPNLWWDTAKQTLYVGSDGVGATARGVTFEDPVVANSSILWGQKASITANATGAGITLSSTGAIANISILRRDSLVGSQEVSNVNFEYVNAAQSAYRIGYIKAFQTVGLTGGECGFLRIETIDCGVNTIRQIIGDTTFAGTMICGSGLQLGVVHSTTGARLAFQHTGTCGYMGTFTSQSLVLRTANADRIIIDTSGNVYLMGLGSGPITAGANDSGGAGFRLLRIPNT